MTPQLCSFYGKLSTAIILFSIEINCGFAAPGDLDPTFGSGGKVRTHVGISNAAINCLALADDKIVVAGYSTLANGSSGFALARYTYAGVLDSTFGDAGLVSTELGNQQDATVYCLALPSDGKIVVAGSLGIGMNRDFTLLRYTSSGVIDLTFGTTTSFDNGSDDVPTCMAIQAGGQILVAGYTSTANNSAFAMARYSSTGKLDPTFGTQGKVVTNFSGSDGISSIVTLPDGRILAAGNTSVSDTDFIVACYTAQGKGLDPSFGSNGQVTTDFGSSDYLVGMVVQSDGKILVAGNSNGNGFALARYTADGHPDLTFGPDHSGKELLSFPADHEVTNLALQADGRILLTFYYGSSGSGGNFGLARCTADGRLDPSFGRSNGKVTTDFSHEQDRASAVAVQPDGRIVLAGNSGNNSIQEFALARYVITEDAAVPTPRVSITGKKKLTTPKSMLALKGRATDAGGILSRVEVKTGKKAYKPAQGTESWKSVIRLKPGRNIVLVRSVDISGTTSPVARVTILRK